MKRTAISLAVVAAALPVSQAALADDRGSKGKKASAFAGVCQFSGELRQRPPLTNTPAAGEASAHARGRCSGTLTDARGRVRELDRERATYFASAAGELSCAGGTATGRGFMQIRGERIDFRFSEVRGPGAGVIRLEGEESGSAAGEARASADEDPAEIVEKCGGEGLRRVEIDIDIATTPEISG